MLTTLPAALQPGRAEPMGALNRDGGVNFAVFSQNATRIELCIFDDAALAGATAELRRYALQGPHDGIWHGFLPGAGPGLVYGLRAHGPYAPEQGHRFNPHKLLLDPNAREIVGRWAPQPEHHGYEVGHPEGARSFDTRDNAAAALKARVAAPQQSERGTGTAPPQFESGAGLAPRVADADVVIYEVHVKNFSQAHPDIPPALRGRYAALAHPAAIAHFKRLGVTTLELLPVQYHLDEGFLAERGLINHWGYNTIGFFCADPRFAVQPDDPAAVNEEFRQMVHTLHSQGIEVLLDVVYNHTPEGNERGPTISFRGLDNRSWYHLAADDRARCENHSGCGNTLNVAHPRVTQFVLDSLRFWVQEMGVDGFRFDLAPVLGRNAHGFDPHAAFFTALMQDPVLARTRLIAEAWDSGPQGYQVGRFPGRWGEWNDKFRDAMRAYWLRTGQAGGQGGGPSGVSRGEFARRFSASSDLFHHSTRRPTASVNFVAVHDGFTLADFTSHAAKHNHANGEDNRDGRDNELCASFGVEGASTDAAVTTLRWRVRRALMATLLLAQGTPMINAGDELGHSQQGNNNAWNQDNATSWIDWSQADEVMANFTAQLLSLRREEPALRHERWFFSAAAPVGERRLVWLNASGAEMQHHDWQDAGQQVLACHLPAVAGTQPDDHALLIAFNPEPRDQGFTLPAGRWLLRLDSSLQSAPGIVFTEASPFKIPARAVLVLRSINPGQTNKP